MEREEIEIGESAHASLELDGDRVDTHASVNPSDELDDGVNNSSGTELYDATSVGDDVGVACISEYVDYPVLTESELLADYFPANVLFEDELADFSADSCMEDCHSSSDTEQCSDQARDKDNVKKPLFEGCPLSLSSSNILLMKFKMRHGLTNEALSDLLKLIKLHCPTPNLCCQSMYFFNKQLMKNLKQPFCFHSFCSACYTVVESVHTKCPNLTCNIDLTDHSKSYFIELPLEAQLASIIESK
jgi:hypothetical protein